MDGIFDEITCLNLWPGPNPCVLESNGPLFLIHSEQKRRSFRWNHVFEFMAGIKTTDPGVQRTIKSTVSNLLYEVCDEILVWNVARNHNLGFWSPLSIWIHSEQKKKAYLMKSLFEFMAWIKFLDPGVHGAIIFNPRWAKETAYLIK